MAIIKIPIRFYYDLGASTALLLRFYCAHAISASIRVILTEISNRGGIAVQWNGGLTYRQANTMQYHLLSGKGNNTHVHAGICSSIIPIFFNVDAAEKCLCLLYGNWQCQGKRNVP